VALGVAVLAMPGLAARRIVLTQRPLRCAVDVVAACNRSVDRAFAVVVAVPLVAHEARRAKHAVDAGEVAAGPESEPRAEREVGRRMVGGKPACVAFPECAKVGAVACADRLLE